MFELPERGNPEAIRILAGVLSPDERRLEALLRGLCWFDYRKLDHVEKTHEFVRAYDRTLTRMAGKNADFTDGYKQAIKARGRVLRNEELLAPWIEIDKDGETRLSRRWQAWVRARRSADKRGLIYDDFCGAAILAAIKRGWTKWPYPNQLASKKLIGGADGYEEATIDYYAKEIRKGRVTTSQDPYYCDASKFRGDKDQLDYYGYLARALLAFYGGAQRAAQSWKGMQRDGRISTSVGFEAALECK